MEYQPQADPLVTACRQRDEARAELAAIKRLCDQYDEFGRVFDPECNLRGLADRVHGCMADVRDRLDRFEMSLPKTADGVPIVPDMLVYIRVGEHVDERRVIGPYGKQALLTHEPPMHGSGGGSTHRLANVCYSSREAAEACRQGV